MTNYYKTVPGRGLMNQTAYDLRMDYLDTLVENIQEDVKSASIKLAHIQNNIESFIGTIEIPLGLIGPILFQKKDATNEWVHSAIATTEGALVASMNRGAKAISESGGFKAHIIHQKMLRTPMFTFENMADALDFDEWIKKHFEAIKSITKKHSNYAELIEISNVIVGKIIHLKFIYTTSDASGQNMTTSCTWNACLWIEEQFQKETGIEILHYVIDGNGASDKKVSFYSLQNGRGIHVISECFLTNEVIEKTLRTNADDMFRSFNHSMAISRFDGMIGYNINVANAIAGIFASTGQDLASIHESSTAILQMEKTSKGLYLSLSLPNLVIGTIGGGTHLPVATRILELMNCKGSGKVDRFAKVISGFTLALEISTLAAIVSGQFARSHQKHGRNKPIKWLLKSEINDDFIVRHTSFNKSDIKEINFESSKHIDNGILTQLTSKVSKKVIGFVQADLIMKNGEEIPMLIKSKALGSEVLDGLHYMASNVDVNLADSFFEHKEALEYNNSHLKELGVYGLLSEINYPFMPKVHGIFQNKAREIHLVILERLERSKALVFNAEDKPELWEGDRINNLVNAIHIVHSTFNPESSGTECISEFDITNSLDLYKTFVNLNRKDYDYLNLDKYFHAMHDFIQEWEVNGYKPVGKKVLIHNDLNPRNVAIRNNELVCIYDWELATFDVPQRDIFEFLAFTFVEEIECGKLERILRSHFHLVREINTPEYSWENYIYDFQLAGKAFIVSRVNFYLAGSLLVNYSFIERVFKASFSILHQLKKL